MLIELDQAMSVSMGGGGQATDRACLEKGIVGNSEGYLK
jgi:hypothetical protein